MNGSASRFGLVKDRDRRKDSINPLFGWDATKDRLEVGCSIPLCVCSVIVVRVHVSFFYYHSFRTFFFVYVHPLPLLFPVPPFVLILSKYRVFVVLFVLVGELNRGEEKIREKIREREREKTHN